jgi:hypothetical protein
MKLFITVFFSLFILSASTQNDPKEAIGDWKGSLELGGGMSLSLIFHITEDNGALTSTMDSPDQQAYGLPMDVTTYKDGTITLTMNQIQGTYKGTLTNGKFDGTWSQAGQSFPLELEKMKKK